MTSLLFIFSLICLIATLIVARPTETTERSDTWNAIDYHLNTQESLDSGVAVDAVYEVLDNSTMPTTKKVHYHHHHRNSSYKKL